VRRRPPTFDRQVEAYGSHPLQVGEWFIPLGGDIATAVVLIHGGFWSKEYDRHLEEHVACDLATRGYLVWNIDYRPAEEGWPATLTDVAAAYDHLSVGAYAGRVDPRRRAVVGHSAGGQLAAWTGSRHRLPAGVPGYNPSVRIPTLVIPQAGVVALALAAEKRVGGLVTQAFVGGSEQKYPERYRIADPVALLPTGVRSVLLHPQRDRTVPISLSKAYVEQAVEAGDDSRLEICRGDHFSHLDPKTASHRMLLETLATMDG
jgi:acetyl esterase/lipase